jgi:alkylation response protein AidB-like acyl-CoA dehydrogenase
MPQTKEERVTAISDQSITELGPIIRLQPSYDEQLLRDSVARLAAGYGPEYFMEKVRAREPVNELWQQLGEHGYLGAFLPEEYGGGGQGVWTLAIVSEELAAAGCPMFPLVYSAAIVSNVLARHGTPEQKAEWLPRLVNGEAKISFAITEPDAGSNSHKISTTARLVGDHWVLNGRKTFISGVDSSDAIMVVARTGTDERTGRGLLSLFLLPTDVPGLERTYIPTAVNAPEGQFALFFDDVKVPADQLVGAQDNGLRVVFEGLNPERILGATLSTGLGRFALDRAVSYVKDREVWGVPIGHHQAVAHPLAKAKIELELAGLMMRKAAALYDAGSPLAGEAANMAKYAAGEAGTLCVDSAIQVHGGNGVALEYGLTDVWWLARFTKIGPVSAEMVLNYVSEHTLGLPKSY